MKIGLACAGSGPGARYAYALAQEMEELSLGPEMISCTSFPSIPLLLWSRGLDGEEIDSRIEKCLRTKKVGKGLSYCCAALPAIGRCAFALNSADQETGVTIVWADRLTSDAWNLKALPLTGQEQMALRAAVSPLLSPPETLDGLSLCDFSVRYGCPFFPLKMAGMGRLLSVVFTGGTAPIAIASESLSVLTGKNADLHFTLGPEDSKGPDAVRHFIRGHQDELYKKLLF